MKLKNWIATKIKIDYVQIVTEFAKYSEYLQLETSVFFLLLIVSYELNQHFLD